jgi:hypothetical protein
MTHSSSPLVTVIVVYQHSMPWIDVCAHSLCHFKNKTPVRVLMVENRPNKSEASMRAGRKLVERHPNAKLLTANTSKVGNPGTRHAVGLLAGYNQVKSPYTMFLDADCIPIRDGWLDDVVDKQADMVGPPAFHNMQDFSIPHAHPSFLLFKTKLADKPYWNKDFNICRVNPDTKKKTFFDTCIIFTHMVGRRPDVNLVRLPQKRCIDLDREYYRIGDMAIHMRGTSNVTRRNYPQDHKKGLMSLREFSFYNPEW